MIFSPEGHPLVRLPDLLAPPPRRAARFCPGKNREAPVKVASRGRERISDSDRGGSSALRIFRFSISNSEHEWRRRREKRPRVYRGIRGHPARFRRCFVNFFAASARKRGGRDIRRGSRASGRQRFQQVKRSASREPPGIRAVRPRRFAASPARALSCFTITVVL